MKKKEKKKASVNGGYRSSFNGLCVLMSNSISISVFFNLISFQSVQFPKLSFVSIAFSLLFFSFFFFLKICEFSVFLSLGLGLWWEGWSGVSAFGDLCFAVIRSGWHWNLGFLLRSPCFESFGLRFLFSDLWLGNCWSYGWNLEVFLFLFLPDWSILIFLLFTILLFF